MSLPICFSLVQILFFLQYYDHDFDKLLLGYFLVNFYRINTFTRRMMYSLEFLWWIYVLWRNWLYNLCKKSLNSKKWDKIKQSLSMTDFYIFHSTHYYYYCFKGRIHLLHFRIWKWFCKIHTYGSMSMAGEFGPHRYLHYSISKLFSEHI